MLRMLSRTALVVVRALGSVLIPETIPVLLLGVFFGYIARDKGDSYDDATAMGVGGEAASVQKWLSVAAAILIAAAGMGISRTRTSAERNVRGMGFWTRDRAAAVTGARPPPEHSSSSLRPLSDTASVSTAAPTNLWNRRQKRRGRGGVAMYDSSTVNREEWARLLVAHNNNSGAGRDEARTNGTRKGGDHNHAGGNDWVLTLDDDKYTVLCIGMGLMIAHRQLGIPPEAVGLGLIPLVVVTRFCALVFPACAGTHGVRAVVFVALLNVIGLVDMFLVGKMDYYSYLSSAFSSSPGPDGRNATIPDGRDRLAGAVLRPVLRPLALPCWTIVAAHYIMLPRMMMTASSAEEEGGGGWLGLGLRALFAAAVLLAPGDLSDASSSLWTAPTSPTALSISAMLLCTTDSAKRAGGHHRPHHHHHHQTATASSSSVPGIDYHTNNYDGDRDEEDEDGSTGSDTTATTDDQEEEEEEEKAVEENSALDETADIIASMLGAWIVMEWIEEIAGALAGTLLAGAILALVVLWMWWGGAAGGGDCGDGEMPVAKKAGDGDCGDGDDNE